MRPAAEKDGWLLRTAKKADLREGDSVADCWNLWVNCMQGSVPEGMYKSEQLTFMQFTY